MLSSDYSLSYSLIQTTHGSLAVFCGVDTVLDAGETNMDTIRDPDPWVYSLLRKQRLRKVLKFALGDVKVLS